ncbi:MAG: STAS domain-containing protein [Silvibacterium sp.]
MSLTVTSRLCGTVCILHCEGRIMAGQASLDLETALEQVGHASTCVILNLSQVTRMDSMGLGMLVRQTSRLNACGGAVRLVAPQPFVAHLLVITKLSDYFQSYPTEEEALEDFLRQHEPQQADTNSGRRVLAFDPSPDIGAFVRSVLEPHGFNVRTACSLRDAKVLLRVDNNVDYILIGPGKPQLAPETAATELSEQAPKAQTLQLGPDFNPSNATKAAETLLQTLRVNSAP